MTVIYKNYPFIAHKTQICVLLHHFLYSVLVVATCFLAWLKAVVSVCAWAWHVDFSWPMCCAAARGECSLPCQGQSKLREERR